MAMTSRRSFMAGSGAAAAVLGMPSRLHSLSFLSRVLQNDGTGATPHRLITVFLRGGADFLNLVVPSDGADRGLYELARPQLQVPVTELLPLGDGPFGLHPGAAPLAELFDDGKLAVVLGAGLPADTRSHFDAQRFIEIGGVSNHGPRSGWLARHLASVPTSDDGEPALLPAVSLGSSTPESFATNNQVVALSGFRGLEFPPEFASWQDAQRTTLRRLYSSGDSAVHNAGIRALNGSNIIELNSGDEFQPRPGIEYPGGDFGRSLEVLARLIKLDLGLATATVDLGGWDTHAAQGNGSGGFFSQKVATLAQGLGAFYADLDGPGDSKRINGTTVVVMSEFGRRLRENSGGTDHGHGGSMFVLGGAVNGGLHGEWPGLSTNQLYDQADLAVTTDYRRVLSEVLIRQLRNPNLGVVFPGYVDYQPLDLVAGDDIEPDYTEAATALDESGLGTDGAASESATEDEATQAQSGAEAASSGVDAVSSGRSAGEGVPLAEIGIGLGAAAVGLGAVALRRRRTGAVVGESDSTSQNPDTSWPKQPVGESEDIAPGADLPEAPGVRE